MPKQLPEIAYSVHMSDWKSSKTLLKAIREQVFIQEQKVPEELEWDDQDDIAHHVLAEVMQEGEKLAIGTARIIIKNKQAHIGRMAVLPAWRGYGIGTRILQTCIAACRQQGITQIVLNAQIYVLAFYQKAGFEICGEQFMDAGIAHNKMTLSLDKE